MAQEEQNTSGSEARSFDKALNEDINDFHLPSNSWTQARNAINNSVSGDLGKLGNEPANKECIKTDYPIIGFIHIIEDKWVIYSTDGGSNSEIGVFTESKCEYFKIVNDSCLGFKLENLIIGVSIPTSNCTYKIYWDDGLNPSRVIEIDADNLNNNLPVNPETGENTIYTGPVAWQQSCTIINGCNYCENIPVLDCNKLRLAQFIDPICVRVEKGYGSGNLLNGSYMIAAAYAVNNQKISDWYVSNIQGLFDHNNVASSLDVFIDSVDDRYDQLIIGIISTINQQTVVRQAGYYSTRQKRIGFDIISDTWPAIPIEQIPIMTPIVDKSDAMYNVGDYLLRVGPTSKFDFNYQPLANQIRVKWQSVEYPADYYYKGGNNTGYMRDEVYPFFIRWVYDTGDKSASYHIPGRPARVYSPLAPLEDDSPYLPIPPTYSNNALPGDTMVFETFNTATQTATFVPGTITTIDGGTVIAEGEMGYWESSEFYPDNKPQIWDASFHCWSALDNTVITPPCPGGPTFLPTPYSGTQISDYDLCGKPIRHHKFPEDGLSQETQLFQNGGSNIRIMGVKFENIRAPKNNEGDTIPGIIGYEILRGSRNGNKTVIAKGIINNMGSYTVPNSSPQEQVLYPNYPYNDLNPDIFLSSTPTSTNTSGNVNGVTPINGFKNDYFTFHSPETSFNNIFLSTKEVRIYGNVYGSVNGKFDLSEKHPKEKLINDLTFILSGLVGIGIASLAANGKRQTTYNNPYNPGYSQDGFSVANISGVGAATAFTITTLGSTPMTPGSDGAQPKFSDSALIGLQQNAVTGIDGIYTGGQQTGAFVLAALSGQDRQNFTLIPLVGLQSNFSQKDNVTTSNAFAKPGNNTTQEDGYVQNLGPIATAFSLPIFLNYWQDGTDSTLRLIKALLRFRDYAVRYHSHGFYNNFAQRPSTFRFSIINQQYVDPEIMQFNTNYKLNNLYRSRVAAIQTSGPIQNPIVSDITRYGYQNIPSAVWPTPSDVTIDDFTSVTLTPSNTNNGQRCSSHYVGLKVRIKNQYSQLNNISQLPTSNCYTAVLFDANGNFIDPNGNIISSSSTNVLFGGDIYINRYTEKNTFFYFYDWLEGQMDGTQINYEQYRMVPYPTYWANFNEFQTSDFTTSIFQNLVSLTPSFSPAIVPSSHYTLDGPVYSGNIFTAIANIKFDKRGWFYLFNSGVRDFFVESEINVAYRDYGEPMGQRFYNPYGGGDTKTLFSTDIIKSGNYYKYDKSLSVTKLFSNYISWGNMQLPAYNPYIAETCFIYQPTRIIYSLPNQFEGLKDGWRVFLPNNYYDFNNYVTCVKPINKSGAIIFFDAASPVQFQGTDQLETGLGTKLTIGDGGLFSQPMQALINTDSSYEYGSCQNRLSVVNTPVGVYWISQNQGKIFTLSGQGLKEVSNINMKWWFAQYLPYNIIKSYPNFELLDNPVLGVSCQATYNNQDGLLYFCKKDYLLRADAPTIPVYLGSNKFLINDYLVIKLGDPTDEVWPLYFEDASWTISFDPKTDNWISYHDWHPNFLLPGKNTFMTVSPNDMTSIWIHNERCDLYCNYYGKDYPFEVEFTVNTGQEVNSLRSIQYQLECYKYAPNCYDRFHKLDFNFDEATIYNTEQTSGLLKLVLSPKQDPTAILQYPIINPTNINVLFSKEENKYRFNQFWDITEDRGEYFNPAIPGFAERAIWNTGANGYVRVLNSFNLNYNKGPFQRKKFRHYTVSVLLRRLVSGNTKMLVMLANTKTLISPR